MNHQYERNLVVEIYRGRRFLQRRRYSYLDTAIPAANRDLIRNGQAGDVAVVHHALTGLEIGTIRMLVSGELRSTWLWDDHYEVPQKLKGEFSNA